METPDTQQPRRDRESLRPSGKPARIGRVSRVPAAYTDLQEMRGQATDGLARGDGAKAVEKIANRNRMIVVIAVSVLILTGAVWRWMSSRIDRRVSASTESMAVEAVTVKRVDPRVASRFPSPSKAESLEIVKRGLAVRDAAEVDGYFHLGAASTQEVTSFLSGLEKSDGPITRYKWRSSIDANGLLLEGVMVWTTKDGEEGSRLAFLMPDETGRWKIDYESLARMVKPTWLELLEGNADSATVRVFIAKDDYFNGPFKDETVWVCHGLASPDCGTVLMGYCKADSPQARALARILTDATRGPANPDPIRATLEIRRPQGAEKRQFEITRVMAEDWVISSKAFDDDFN